MEQTKLKDPFLKNYVPVLPIKDVIVFPQMVAPIWVMNEFPIKAIEKANKNDLSYIILLAKIDPAVEDFKTENFASIGVLAKIVQVIKFPDDSIKAVIEGISRISVTKLFDKDSVCMAEFSEMEEIEHQDTKTKTLLKLSINKFKTYVKKNNKMSTENLHALSTFNDKPGKFADIMATYVELEVGEKQQILEIADTTIRLEAMSQILEREIQVLDIEDVINDKLKSNLSKNQKDFYLKEKLKIIKEELNEKSESINQSQEYKEKIKAIQLNEKHEAKLLKEVARLEQMPPYSSEVSVIRTYLDRIIELPWNEKTDDFNDLEYALEVLNGDHWGLENIKKRIIEYLAVKKLSNKKQTNILCFVGPPGVGKTSLVKSIAKSMGRKFSYISLGGINDESEIRGHRRTYIGAMPGRIIQAVEHTGTKNPVILLDEIDKMIRSHMGDPTAAMLEVLDPEQNPNFTDHYIDLPFDLSEVFFIATANTLEPIYKALRDRLEVIQLSSYTDEEKINIAKYFLIGKQLDSHGIKNSQLKISDSCLKKIINEYTKEPGVRNLERSIARICRKVAYEIVQDKISKVNITNKNIKEYMGIPKYTEEDNRKTPEIGIINGLAWTEVGGTLLPIEVSKMPGKGKLNLTGSLGDVMQESAKIAISYLRSKYDKYSIEKDIQDKYDIHIHFPDGATPKDGPSAGLAITLAIMSVLQDKPIRSDIALTGEITLRGKVFPIGGLKEKVLAAIRNKIPTVIVPSLNKKDALELADYIQDQVKFIYVNNIDDAILHVF